MPALALLLATTLAAAPSSLNADAMTDPVDAWREQRSAAAQVLAAGRPGTPEARLNLARRALDGGLALDALALLDAETDAITATGGRADGLALRAEALAALSRFTDVAALAGELALRGNTIAHFLSGDLAGVQRIVRGMKPDDPRRALAEAEILRRTNDPAGAEPRFRGALEAGAPPAAALLGLSRCALRLGRTDEATDLARRAALAEGSRPATLEQWAQCLSRAGRTKDAVAVNVAVAEGFPWAEGAHYQLGNGSALLSYSELEKDAPGAFPRDADFVAVLDAVKALALRGEVAAARERLVQLATEPPAILASLAWNDGELDAAEGHARESLLREPRHGRAHAVLARVVESRRFAIHLVWSDPVNPATTRASASAFRFGACLVLFRPRKEGSADEGASSTTSHPGIRGLLRRTGAEPHDRYPSGDGRCLRGADSDGAAVLPLRGNAHSPIVAVLVRRPNLPPGRCPQVVCCVSWFRPTRAPGA